MKNITIFERSLQKTHAWLNDIAAQANLADDHMSLAVLRATLHQLRDNLPIEVIAHLSAQLPLIIRGIYFENWDPRTCPVKDRKLDVFFQAISKQLAIYPTINVEKAVMAVFHTLTTHCSAGEIKKIRSILPAPIEVFWKKTLKTETEAESPGFFEINFIKGGEI